MTDEELNTELSKFAQDTGRTILEWLTMWRSFQIDETQPKNQELYNRAIALEQAWIER